MSTLAKIPAVVTMKLPEKILVVDDDPLIRKMLCQTFRNSAEVLQARDGAEGLSLIHEANPEFVITDLMMPNLDGLELLTQARQTFVGATVPILVLTARGEESSLLDCFQRGADDYMVKPFSIDELRIRVASIFIRQSQARDINPLTRLPGNLILKREIESRWKEAAPLAVAYVDLDHFKTFNDTQGFDRGDRIIELLGDCLRDFAMERTPGEIFVGHVGGDDFVVLLPLDEVHALTTVVHETLNSVVKMIYTPTELERGVVRSQNRAGEIDEIPLISASIGVVSNQRQGVSDVRAISQVAAEVKKMAKQISGNSVFIDRRKD